MAITIEKNEYTVKLSVHDDGNGFPEGFDPANREGFGLSLVKMLTRSLGANLHFDSRDGLPVSLEIPL